MYLAKDMEISTGERIGRYIKDMFSEDDLSKTNNDQEFESYLRLFSKAENIQCARYIELNK